jgi:predicted ATPase/DNA-binding winged helix-turn-helix (wHTH) protein
MQRMLRSAAAPVLGSDLNRSECGGRAHPVEPLAPTIGGMETSYRFNQCELLPAQRQLLDGGRPVKLGSRAFDMLLVLVERRERVVNKHELMDLVWPQLVVEENNLQVHVLALRKLLGHGAIATIPGRGYRFTLPVSVEGATAAEPVQPAAPGAPSAPPRLGNLPVHTPALYGREHELQELQGLMQQHPLVTVTGAGGIGKTRLAQSAAGALATPPADGVWWVELAGLNDAALVPAAVGQALGLQLGAQTDATGAVLQALQGKAALLVLDNAEHLLDAVAQFVALLRERASGVKLLVTSQEVLRGLGEQVFRPGPLALPQGDGIEALRASGAVALFVARAQQADPRFALNEDNSAAVADICRRLDGIPLAIELAAARVPLLGVAGLRQRLDERFQVLTAGSRAVMRRHQTLRAALEWSHALLTPAEQVVLRRLAACVGGFTLEAAQEIAGDSSIDSWEVLELLGALVDKSFVVAEGQPLPRYRMLETTRLYGLERLAEAGETAVVLLRHARCFMAAAEAFDDEVQNRRAPGAAPRALLDLERDNLLHALAWCDQDDAAAATVGLRLAGAMYRYWPARGLIGVGLAVTRRALDRAASQPADRYHCRALAAVAALLFHARRLAEAELAAQVLLAAAEVVESARHLATAHYLLGHMATERQAWPAAHEHIESLRAIARSLDSLHLEGDALVCLTNVLTRQGRLDEAAVHGRELVDLRRRAGASHNLASALLFLSSVALEHDDTATAASALAEALVHVRVENARGLNWGWCGDVGALAARRGHWVVTTMLAASVARWRKVDGLAAYDQDLDVRYADQARAALSEAAFREAWAAGEAFSEAEAMACAEAELGLQP